MSSILSYSVNHPRPAPGTFTYTEFGDLIPNQTNKTIGDLLTAKTLPGLVFGRLG